MVAHTGAGTWAERFENRVLTRIFGPKRDKVRGEWRKLRNEELNHLYCSPNIVRMIKSRRMRWAGHATRMEEKRGVCIVLVGKLRERDLLEDPGLDGRIILKWNFRQWDMRAWTGSMWLRLETRDSHF